MTLDAESTESTEIPQLRTRLLASSWFIPIFVAFIGFALSFNVGTWPWSLAVVGLGVLLGGESASSWATVIRDLRDRGMEPPLLACGDGALGLWAALNEVFPTTKHQRCWNHRVLNVLDKVPKRLWPETRRRLREAWSSESRAECELRRDALVRWLEAHGQMSAAETMVRDWDDFVTFYDLPAEHWIHIRTSNPIESLFAGVRLRTNVAKRMRRRENALYLVFKSPSASSTPGGP